MQLTEKYAAEGYAAEGEISVDGGTVYAAEGGIWT